MQNARAGGRGEARWATQLVVSPPLCWQRSSLPLMLLKTDCGEPVAGSEACKAMMKFLLAARKQTPISSGFKFLFIIKESFSWLNLVS